MAYVKLEKIGRGSFGKIYKVKNAETSEILVMKKISLAALSRRQQKDVQNEVYILKSLEHPNILSFIDAFILNSKLCIITEFCENGDVSKFLKNASALLPEETILKIFIQVALGVEYLHRKNVIHRDIKPMNIFLKKDMRVKIGDVGVAKMLSDISHLTQTVVGTPFYFAPEVCQKQAYNYKTDIWGLGCLLYELCCKTHPFLEEKDKSLATNIIYSAQKALPEIYSSELKAIAEKLLRKDPKERPSINKILNSDFIQQKMQEYGMLPNFFTIKLNTIQNKPTRENSEDKANHLVRPTAPPYARLREEKYYRTIDKHYHEKTFQGERNRLVAPRFSSIGSRRANGPMTLHRRCQTTFEHGQGKGALFQSLKSEEQLLENAIDVHIIDASPLYQPWAKSSLESKQKNSTRQMNRLLRKRQHYQNQCTKLIEQEDFQNIYVTLLTSYSNFCASTLIEASYKNLNSFDRYSRKALTHLLKLDIKIERLLLQQGII